MSNKTLIIAVVAALIFGLVLPFFVINTRSSNSTDSPAGQCIADDQCIGMADGEPCTAGVWCDEQGRICGGEECTGLIDSQCVDEICESKP